MWVSDKITQYFVLHWMILDVFFLGFWMIFYILQRAGQGRDRSSIPRSEQAQWRDCCGERLNWYREREIHNLFILTKQSNSLKMHEDRTLYTSHWSSSWDLHFRWRHSTSCHTCDRKRFKWGSSRSVPIKTILQCVQVENSCWPDRRCWRRWSTRTLWSCWQ